MNKLEQLIKQKEETEKLIFDIKEQIKGFNTIVNRIKEIDNILKVLDNWTLEKEHFYLCKSYENSIKEESINMMKYTTMNITNETCYDDWDLPDDDIMTFYTPILKDNIPIKLLNDMRGKYKEILIKEKVELEKQLD